MDKVRNKNPEDLLSNIPPELKLEILLKLPAKSIVNLSFVSKHWSYIIRDKDFTELYLTRSFTWPRLLVKVYRLGMHFFHSRSLEDPSSDHHHRTTLIPKPDSWIEFSQPVRGFICCSYGTDQVLIGNPSTGQFVALPRVKTSKSWFQLFFGYEPVNDQYKVLGMTYPLVPFGKFKRVIGSDEHQIFTLGAKQRWRKIEYKHHAAGYPPTSEGKCMDGVVYYLTQSDDDRRPHYLISFNLRSEDFNVIEFPEDMKYSSECLNPVNYGGKIALSNRSCNGKLDLWIQKDASNQEWSKVSLLVPSWEKLVGIDYWLNFSGTLSTGELIFVPSPSHPPFFIIYYDLKDSHARKVVMEGLGDDFHHIRVYLDHAESPFFIPKVIS